MILFGKDLPIPELTALAIVFIHLIRAGFSMFTNSNTPISGFPAYAFSASGKQAGGLIIRTRSSDLGARSEVDYLLAKALRRFAYGTRVNLDLSLAGRNKLLGFIQNHFGNDFWSHHQHNISTWL